MKKFGKRGEQKEKPGKKKLKDKAPLTTVYEELRTKKGTRYWKGEMCVSIGGGLV